MTATKRRTVPHRHGTAAGDTSLVEGARKLAQRLDELTFSLPASFVYNPLQYAFAPHADYLRRFGDRGEPHRIVLLGMNPGPFGMAQIGVPFGAVNHARDWLLVRGAIAEPRHATHPRRPVTGWQTERIEKSGDRLWGWARARFETPERFFRRFFVVNYCPLMFLDAGGRNITPDRLVAAERVELERRCDEALAELHDILQPKLWIGVGGYARQCLERALAASATGATTSVSIGQILHPSPANPAANRGWVEVMEKQLREMGVEI